MATPFDREGALDLEGARRLAGYLVEHGSDGLVVTGSTGESPTLADDERLEVCRAVVEAVTVPVIVGSTSNDTAHSIELTAAAEKAGAAGILAVTPYYNRPSQAGLFAHFQAIANATSLPVVLYDIPVRTGRKIASATILRLAREVPNIVALKDAAGDPAATAQVLAAAPAGFCCYSGDDALTLPLLAVGAVGLIGVATHWAGPEIRAMIDAFFAGDLSTALAYHTALLESFSFETGEDAPNPQPLKAMLARMGLPGGECRLPLGPAPEAVAVRAAEVLAKLGEFRARGVGGG